MFADLLLATAIFYMPDADNDAQQTTFWHALYKLYVVLCTAAISHMVSKYTTRIYSTVKSAGKAINM